jgi:hypothetical protein
MLLIATIAIGVWRTALRQISLSGDQARVALGQAICLAARYANRLRGNVTGAPWIACARKIVGLECQHSGLVFEPALPRRVPAARSRLPCLFPHRARHGRRTGADAD